MFNFIVNLKVEKNYDNNYSMASGSFVQYVKLILSLNYGNSYTITDL